MRRKFSLVTSVASLALSASIAMVLFAGAAQAQQKVILKFSHVVAEATPKGRGVLKFREVAERLLPGRVQVLVFPNSQLFGDSKELDALLAGDVQFIAPSLSKFERYTRKLQVFDLPFLFDDIDAVDRFQHGPVGRALLDSMTGRGIKGLAYWHNGLKELSTDRERLRRPEDIRGLKIRIQPSDVLDAQFRALGAIPEKIAFSEVFQALQSGVVNGQENTWSNIYSQRFHEVQKTIAVTNHGVLDYMVVTNAAWWNKLPPDIRSGLQQAMDEATAYANKLALDLNEKDRARIVRAGRARVEPLSKEDIAAWRKAMEPVWSKFEMQIGKDLIQSALKSNS